jgi:DNA-binding response OmpR family regulator
MARERPSLLLVDATFPGVELDELIRLVRPHVGTCPVVMFSDRPPAVIEALVRDIGAAGSIPKEAAGGELWTRLQPFFSQT